MFVMFDDAIGAIELDQLPWMVEYSVALIGFAFDDPKLPEKMAIKAIALKILKYPLQIGKNGLDS